MINEANEMITRHNQSYHLQIYKVDQKT